MTAPVARQSGQKIAVTAPVAKTSGADGGSVVRFFMPAGWTMVTLPEPNDDEVGLVTVPGETVAVLRFTGDRGSAAVAARATELLDALKDTAFEPTGTPVGWFYDPPWTLPFRRRNEVAVPVAHRSPTKSLASVLVAHRCFLVVESVKFGVGITQREVPVAAEPVRVQAFNAPSDTGCPPVFGGVGGSESFLPQHRGQRCVGFSVHPGRVGRV